MTDIKRWMEGRKTVEKIVEGEFEHQKIHIVKLEDKGVIDIIYDIAEYYDDPECTYEHGILYSWDDLYGIEADQFIEAVDEYIAHKIEWNGDTEEDESIIAARKAQNYFKAYKGYSFYIRND